VKVTVVIPNGPEEDYDAIKEAEHEITFGPYGSNRFAKISAEDVIGLARDADCLVFNVVHRDVMEALPRLSTVVSPYVGYDTIDVTAATELGIVVCNTVTPLTPIATAESAVALLFTLAKRVMRRHTRLRDGGWVDDTDNAVLMAGSTVGIVGLGRIGASVARRLAGWDVRILVHTRTPNPKLLAELGAEAADLPTLLRESDFVTLHAPHTPETTNLIDEAALRSMKRTASLVNTSRGPLVNEAALHRALIGGWIHSAAIDVYVEEPLSTDSPLRSLDPERLLLTPHAMSATEAARVATKRQIVETIITAMGGEIPKLALNPDVQPRWRASSVSESD
jgi:lactate dehydrogenase-like 2-hydroxyacid dehydrogenase